jgi:hypothetical protein
MNAFNIRLWITMIGSTNGQEAPKRGKEAQINGEEAPQLVEEKEGEGHFKCMQNLHGLIALIKVISNGRWHAMWFLTVEEICLLKDDHVRYGQDHV